MFVIWSFSYFVLLVRLDCDVMFNKKYWQKKCLKENVFVSGYLKKEVMKIDTENTLTCCVNHAPDLQALLFQKINELLNSY